MWGGRGGGEKFSVCLVTCADVFEIKLKLICSETVDTIGKLSTSEHTGAFFIYLFYPAFNFLCFVLSPHGWLDVRRKFILFLCLVCSNSFLWSFFFLNSNIKSNPCKGRQRSSRDLSHVVRE